MRVEQHLIQQALTFIHSNKAVAIDTETNGLHWGAQAFSIQVASDNFEFYFDARIIGWSGLEKVVDSLNTFKGIVVGQNLKFDMRCAGLDLPEAMLADIEVLARLVDNTHMSYRLADQAKRYGMEKLDEVAEYVKKNKIKDWSQVPLDIMEKYATHDARITYDLYLNYIKQLDPRSFDIWLTECKLTRVCYEIEKKGIAIDLNYTKDALSSEGGLILEAKSRFHALTGLEYDNKKSTLIKVFTEAGDEIPLTDKGNPSLDDDVLSNLKSPAAHLVQEIRHYEKRVATYYENFLELQRDGIIHADMRQAGTTTGRFSYRNPNLQNIPKEDQEEDKTKPYIVRGCFVPRPGNIFVSMDFKAQEYRLMLAYAKESSLINAVMSGHDVHQATADMLGTQRKIAKNINFACLYGAGRNKIAEMTGLHVAEAGRMLDKYFMRLPAVEKLISRVPRTSETRGHIYTWKGRKLKLPNKQMSYKMVNYLIQGGCADIVKQAMVELWKNEQAPMVLQVHDQILFEMPIEKARQKVETYKKIMEDVFPEMNGIRMEVDVTWSDKSFAERDMQKWN